MARDTRTVSWIKAARKDFEKFPDDARRIVLEALTVVAEGQTPDLAKPLKGLGPGVFEIALRHRGEAYRTVYALQIADEIWIIHAFQKKSKTGIKTPRQDIELIRTRIKRLKEMLT